MSLKIKLAPQEFMWVEGVTVRNQDKRETKLTIEADAESPARVLRQRDILAQSEVDTPTRKLYFHLQMMYMDSDAFHRPAFEAQFERLYRIFESTSEVAEKMDAAKKHADDGDYYRALGLVRDVIQYERLVMKYDEVRDDLEKIASEC